MINGQQKNTRWGKMTVNHRYTNQVIISQYFLDRS